jgi:hypothetical protein
MTAYNLSARELLNRGFSKKGTGMTTGSGRVNYEGEAILNNRGVPL